MQTVEKIPNGVDLIARGPAGHGSVPLMTNAIAHLSKAVAAVTDWQPPIDLNDTTAAYFSRLAAISPPEQARRYRDVLTGDAQAVAAADAWLRENEPRHASMLRTSVSPNIIQGGYRNNVIPSEAKVTLDVRMLPRRIPKRSSRRSRRSSTIRRSRPCSTAGRATDHRQAAQRRRVVHRQRRVQGHRSRRHEALPDDDPSHDEHGRERHGVSSRAKGMQCYGIGPATDVEDGPKGFGAHSDQERILEAELHRFVRFHWDIVVNLAGSSRP